MKKIILGIGIGLILMSVLTLFFPSGYAIAKSAEEYEAQYEKYFGKAYGKVSGGPHLLYSTSMYMIGDIAVGIFFLPGEQGNWTTQEINDTFSSICNSLNKLVAIEPNAHLSFKFINEGTKPFMKGNSDSRLDEYEYYYINKLRDTYKTHWAYAIGVYKGKKSRPLAFPFGPFAYIDGKDLQGDHVVLHETMHIFGAIDQYGDKATLFAYPENLAGYLYVSNSNSESNSGKGYFNGAGEGQEDLMIRGATIGVYTRGQIGWRDSDGDGTLDPQDTFSDITSLTRSTTYPYAYTGKAIDKPLRYCDPSYTYGYYLRGGDVSINSIKSVEYRVNGGAWCAASPVDGSFDSGEEQFLFMLPFLSEGNYKVEVRAANSVGNVEVSYAKDEFSIPKNAITNTTPFAAFSVVSPKGSIDTNFVFDASLSSDIEDDISKLQVRWDFNNDGVWDTAFSNNNITSFRYSSAGTKTVKLQVKDTSGLTGMVTKQIEVAGSNISPKAFFTVTPENQHGAYETFPVKLDATGSWDAEDDKGELLVRWDFDNDGVWDEGYSHTLITEHTYKITGNISKHFRVVLDVSDKKGCHNYATRDVWCNTYNHPPYPKIQKDSETVFTILGNDPDKNTTWDGLLEYRWDFNNDGTWDKAFFEGSNKLSIKPEYYGYTIMGEVRDRFGAIGKVAFYTKPLTPIVIDEGSSTLKGNSLYAVWQDVYREPILNVEEYNWGIDEYQWKVTQDSPKGSIITEGGIKIKGVRYAGGFQKEIFANGLNLICGKEYYVGLRIKNTLGVLGDYGYSDGITFIDTTPPVITHTPITMVSGNKDVEISAMVIDSGSGVDYVSIYWSLGWGPGLNYNWKSLKVTKQENVIYKATLSGTEVKDHNFSYFITGRDKAGNPCNPQVYNVTVDAVVPTVTHTPITSAPKNKDIVFTAIVTDLGSGVDSVTLYWRKRVFKLFGWTWSELRQEQMINQGSNVYKTTLLGSQVEDRNIKYYISAKDRTGNITNTQEYEINR